MASTTVISPKSGEIWISYKNESFPQNILDFIGSLLM